MTAVRARIDGEIKKEASVVNSLVPNETTIAAIMEVRSGKLRSARSIKELKKALHADDYEELQPYLEL
jgi:antitoxin component of RelBE/YafQ-DinJ toxin-antitoxin module